MAVLAGSGVSVGAGDAVGVRVAVGVAVRVAVGLTVGSGASSASAGLFCGCLPRGAGTIRFAQVLPIFTAAELVIGA